MAADDVAKSCVFFCSDYAKNVTGKNLYVDAGYVLN
ncbi:SDR family oxidoreductase [Oceanobacillus neutriphilus]